MMMSWTLRYKSQPPKTCVWIFHLEPYIIICWLAKLDWQFSWHKAEKVIAKSFLMRQFEFEYICWLWRFEERKFNSQSPQRLRSIQSSFFNNHQLVYWFIVTNWIDKLCCRFYYIYTNRDNIDVVSSLSWRVEYFRIAKEQAIFNGNSGLLELASKNKLWTSTIIQLFEFYDVMKFTWSDVW